MSDQWRYARVEMPEEGVATINGMSRVVSCQAEFGVPDGAHFTHPAGHNTLGRTQRG